MTINWKDIKTEILAETKDVFQSEPNFDINETFDLFVKVLAFPIEESILEGVATRIPNALQKIFLENLSRIDKNAYFPDVANNLEPYFRKILFIISPNDYQRIVSDKDGFASVIRALNLKPNNINLNSTYLNPNQRTNFAEHLIKSYQLRNLESHNCTDWNNVKLYDELRSILVMYLVATHKHFKVLKLAIEPNDLTDYLKEQIKIYREWSKKNNIGFVHIDGLEDDLVPMDLSVTEYIENEEENENEDEEDFDIEITEKRQGTIDYLRKNKVEERKMIVRGDLGMGKTTTLRHLAYLDAQDALIDNQKSIPVVFVLKDFVEKDNLVQKIIKTLDIDKESVVDLLEKGKINFFFDGLNEVRQTLISTVNTQIIQLLNDFPKNFYLISTRPQSYESTSRSFDDDYKNRKLPIFDLQKLNSNRLEEFLEKNGKQVKAKILETVANNEAWRKITSNPLMLKMLITVAISNKGNVPSETGKIIRSFMDYLYERERNQRRGNFDKDIFHLLLCHLAYETRSLTEANASLDKNEYILPILKECKDSLQISKKKEQGLAPTDLLDFLKIAVDMNVLTETENQYSFTYELHQIYYFTEYAQKNGKLLI